MLLLLDRNQDKNRCKILKISEELSEDPLQIRVSERKK